jgi:hypothetical protein
VAVAVVVCQELLLSCDLIKFVHPKKPKKTRKNNNLLPLSLSRKERKSTNKKIHQFFSFHFMSELYLHCLFWVNGIWGQLIKW